GVASHTVGDGTQTSVGGLTAALFDYSGDIFLQVAIDTAGNFVLPRTRLDPVPFAITSLESGGSVPLAASVLTTSTASPAGFSFTGNNLTGRGFWTAIPDMPTS